MAATRKSSTSNLTYLFQNHWKELKNGKMFELEEKIMDGPRGVSFKLFKKESGKVLKYTAKQNEDGTFNLYVIDGDKKDVQTLSRADLLKTIKTVKALAFAVKYLSSAQGRSRSMKRARSRKSRRKSRKSKSRKSRKSRKSKGKSRRGSKRKPRRGSKRKSRKGSKRKSRRRSKRRSCK